jgi:hypothetical protein
MLTKVGCISGCKLVIRNSNHKKTVYQTATCLLYCSHGLVIKEKSGIEYDGEDDGPSNVKKET